MGYHDETYDLPFGEVWSRNLTVRFGFVNATRIPTLLSLIDAGRIDLDPLYTREVALSDVDGKADLVGPGTIKTVIDPQS